MRKLLIGILFIMVCTRGASQNNSHSLRSHNLHYGIKSGLTYSSISNLESTILSETYFLDYTLKYKSRYGWTAGAFLNYIPGDGEYLAIYTEIMYARQGSDLLFNNTQKDFNYKIQFAYEYVNILGLIQIYPFSKGSDTKNRLSIGVGPQFGFNVAPQNIKYTSWGKDKLPAFGSDLEQQQQLRNVLKGKNNFGFNFGLGYEHVNSGLSVDVRYFVGVTDLVETQANTYNFIENKNTGKYIQLLVAWQFCLFQKE